MSTQNNNPLSENEIFQLQEKIAALQDALVTANPGMPTLLREIHNTIKLNPEQVTLLDEEAIGTVVQALSKLTGISVSAAALKSNKKSLKSMTLDDL